jgi:hypothetical protein
VLLLIEEDDEEEASMALVGLLAKQLGDEDPINFYLKKKFLNHFNLTND